MHRNKINNKKYIGITHQKPERRWRNGKGYRCGCFKNAIEKYGWDNFEHTILCNKLTFEDATQKEKYYISLYNTKSPNGYNLTDGGEGTVNWIPSKEFRERQSIIQKKKWTEDYKKKISIERRKENSIYQSSYFRNKISKLVSNEKNPNFNNKWSDLQKEKLRQKQKK